MAGSGEAWPGGCDRQLGSRVGAPGCAAAPAASGGGTGALGGSASEGRAQAAVCAVTRAGGAGGGYRGVQAGRHFEGREWEGAVGGGCGLFRAGMPGWTGRRVAFVGGTRWSRGRVVIGQIGCGCRGGCRDSHRGGSGDGHGGEGEGSGQRRRREGVPYCSGQDGADRCIWGRRIESTQRAKLRVFERLAAGFGRGGRRPGAAQGSPARRDGLVAAPHRGGWRTRGR